MHRQDRGARQALFRSGIAVALACSLALPATSAAAQDGQGDPPPSNRVTN